MRRRILAAVLAPTIAALSVSGCTGDSRSGDDTLPEGVSAVLVQQRADVAVRELQVRIRNERDGPIIVGDVAVEDDRFDGTAVREVERESSLAAGASVDVRVVLPSMDCAAGDDGSSRVTVHLVVDGAELVAQGPAPDALDVLAGIHRRECLGARLAAVADVQLTAFEEADAGEPAALEVDVARRGAGSVRISAVRSTPLLTFDETAATSLELDAELGEEATRLDIPLVPQRCDPHVVQEDKRGTVFTFTVEVDGERGDVDIAAAPEMKARMLSWVARWCGFGE